MLKCFRDSIRMSQNIARQLGVDCPINILYIDSILDNLVRVKNALNLLRERSYKIDTLINPKEVAKLINASSYDALLVNETLQIHQTDCPLIIVPNYVLNLTSKWKLAYTLDELIHDTIAVPLYKAQQQQIALV